MCAQVGGTGGGGETLLFLDVELFADVRGPARFSYVISPRYSIDVAITNPKLSQERFEVVGDDVVDGEQPTLTVAPKSRVTTKYLTKYERARVLGTRALQSM